MQFVRIKRCDIYNNEMKKSKTREMNTWIDKVMVIRTSFMQYIENN